MPSGGKLEIGIMWSPKDREGKTIVTIEDTGSGIPKELIPKLFQPFFTTKDYGVGLGLPIADGIIRSHGGKLHFESNEKVGTKVTIEFPITED